MAITSSPSPHYTWTFPGAPVRIHVQLEVIRTLQEILTAPSGLKHDKDLEFTGVLLGIPSGGGTEITGIVEALGTGPQAIAAALQTLKPSTQGKPVGFYRTQTDPSFRFTSEDMEIAKQYFARPGDVFLIIHRSEECADNATFFFWDHNQIHQDFAFLEFPFDAQMLASREKQRLQAQKQAVTAAPAAKPAGKPVAAPPAKPRPARSRWTYVAIACLLTIGLLLAADRFLRSYSSAPATISASLTPIPAASPNLGLRFQHQGTDLIVTWDRDEVARSGAAAGLLSIRDGAVEKQIGLSSDQLRSANVLLSPKGDQVQLQLTLLLPNQRTLSESGLAVLSSNGAADRFVQPVATAPRPVTAEQVSQLAAKPAPAKAFTPPPVETAAAERQLFEEPPAPVPSGLRVAALPTQALAPITPAIANQAPAVNRSPVTTTPSTPTTTNPGSIESNVQPAQFLGGKNPVFPTAAHNARVQGVVVIEALVTPDGKVKQVKVVSGHPLLRDAALTAVRTWTFKPALINGKAVEAPTRVEVNFRGKW